MTDISAGIASLALGDGNDPEVFNSIGELKDPLPSISIERASLDNSGAASKVETTRAGMKKIGAQTYKIEADPSNPQISALWDAFNSGGQKNWQFIYAVNGDTETCTFAGWVSKMEISPQIKDYTYITLTINLNSESRA